MAGKSINCSAEVSFQFDFAPAKSGQNEARTNMADYAANLNKSNLHGRSMELRFYILEVCSRHQNEACGNSSTWNKWMPNLDSTSKLMPERKILGQYDLPNFFYGF